MEHWQPFRPTNQDVPVFPIILSTRYQIPQEMKIVPSRSLMQPLPASHPVGDTVPNLHDASSPHTAAMLCHWIGSNRSLTTLALEPNSAVSVILHKIRPNQQASHESTNTDTTPQYSHTTVSSLYIPWKNRRPRLKLPTSDDLAASPMRRRLRKRANMRTQIPAQWIHTIEAAPPTHTVASALIK